MKNSNAEKQARDAAYSLRGAKVALVAICLVIVLSFGVGITLALLVDGSESVVNTFDPGKIVIAVNETFSNNVKTNVSIKNDQPHGSNIDSYIRVALVANWVDDATPEPNIVGAGAPVAGTDYTITINNSDWFLGSDGYYYCKAPVAPNENTPVLINRCEVVSANVPAGCNFELKILAQGIQTVPTTTVESVWPVTVGSNGQLSAASGN